MDSPIGAKRARLVAWEFACMPEKNCRRLMEVLSRMEGQKMSELRCSFCVAFHGIAETGM